MRLDWQRFSISRGADSYLGWPLTCNSRALRLLNFRIFASRRSFWRTFLGLLREQVMYIIGSGYKVEHLVQEAIVLKHRAVAIDSTVSGYDVELGAIRGRRKHLVSSGPVLVSAHETEILAHCRKFFGVDYVATRASYIYLDEFSRIDFHHDSPACSVTCAICLTDHRADILLLPMSSENSLLKTISDVHGKGAELQAECDIVRLRQGAQVMFEGRKLLHALADHESDMILATMCFAKA
jgi:hypothetical protein